MESRNYNRLKTIISNFKNGKVLVIGDLILDEFIWGDVSRISPEAPVPVVWVKNESFMPGGASNVANNLKALGSQVHLTGIIGDDEHGSVLKGQLDERGVNTDGMLADSSRPTILKTRVVAQHQQIVRIDREKIGPLGDDIVSKMIEYIDSVIDAVDAVIIEDYGKGVVTPKLLRHIVPLARARKKIISVDPKEEHFSYYKGINVITPNNHEASRAVGFEIKDEPSLRKAGNALLAKIKCKIALVTLGENGMAVFQKNKAMKHIPTAAQEVFDVSGAGDTVIASYTLALASGANPIQAAYIANCAAGIVVGKVGIAVVTPGELTARVKKELRGGI